jgi:FkbM family methyltransferase
MLGLGRYAVKTVNGTYKMRLDLKDRGISQGLYLYGTRERDQVYIVRNNVKRGMNVLDIGANIGYYVLLEAGLVGEEGRIYAFEPHPENARMLKANLELNNFSDKVELRQMGMSDRAGAAEFFVSSRSNLHTMNPVAFKGRKNTDFEGSISIDTADVTGFLLDKKEVDFIRMDIEGHEVEVLNGVVRALEGIEAPPSILFETHISRYDDSSHDMKSTLKDLFARGYFVDAIVSNHVPHKVLGGKYGLERAIKTDQVTRGIYRDIDYDDAIRCICEEGGIRAVFLKNRKVR